MRTIEASSERHESMVNPQEQGKKCPDCGQTLKPEVHICRHCGYVFPYGKAAHAGPLGLTHELTAQSATTGKVSTWVNLLWPVLAVFVVVALAFAVFHGGWHTITWESAQHGLPAAKSYDSQFEAFIIAAYRQDGMAADACARDGVCLINVDKEVPSGLLRRLATKLGALGIACSYAAVRHQHGDTPVATVTIFTNGRRYASTTCDCQKHPELLR